MLRTSLLGVLVACSGARAQSFQDLAADGFTMLSYTLKGGETINGMPEFFGVQNSNYASGGTSGGLVDANVAMGTGVEMTASILDGLGTGTSVDISVELTRQLTILSPEVVNVQGTSFLETELSYLDLFVPADTSFTFTSGSPNITFSEGTSGSITGGSVVRISFGGSVALGYGDDGVNETQTVNATLLLPGIVLCPRIIEVGGFNGIPSIQTAIDIASDGDTIEVHPGTYTETLDLSGKAITLRSIDGPLATTISGGGSAETVILANSGEGPGTRLEGFLINGASGFGPGGGMRIDAASPYVEACVFFGNDSSSGGAVDLRNGSDATFINCFFLNNSGTVQGGAVSSIDGDTSTFMNCNFIANSSPAGASFYEFNANPTVTNCIFWNHQSPPILALGPGAPTVTYCVVDGGYPGAGNINADPIFLDEGANDYRLSVGSPAIDAGDGTPYLATFAGVRHDILGARRLEDALHYADLGPAGPDGLRVDIGCFEAPYITPGPCRADFNDDGALNGIDVGLFLQQYATGCP